MKFNIKNSNNNISTLNCLGNYKNNSIFLIFSILFIIITIVNSSVINTSKYNGYALIGSNPNSRMSFTTLLTKPNKTLPFSSTNKYEISQIINEPTKSFGSSVALGSATYKGSNITIGAIGDSSEGSIYIYDIESCANSSLSKTKCDYFFVQESVKQKDDFQCLLGTSIGIGPNFIVSTCQNNLLSKKTASSPISVCILDLDSDSTNCTQTLYVEDLSWKPCLGGKGQMYPTSINVYENKIVVGLCSICMSPNKSQIQIEYQSAFVLLEVVNQTLSKDYLVQATHRTQSCPSTITFNDNWVVIGYSEEEFVDLYFREKNSTNSSSSLSSSSSSSSSSSTSSSSSSSTSSNSNSKVENSDSNNNCYLCGNTKQDGSLSNMTFTLFDTVYQPDAVGYGVDIAISSSMLLVSSTGDPNQNITSNVFIYDIFTDNSSYPVRSGPKAQVPNLNYKTTFSYQYGISFYGSEVLVISQDASLKKMGFDFYGICPPGMEWSSDYLKCMLCQAGQYKAVSLIHHDNSSFELCELCPGGWQTGQVYGLTSIQECQQTQCNSQEFCPDGSVFPLKSVVVATQSNAVPDLDESEELDFESTFYNSCYPYFLIILAGMIIITLIVCLPWSKNKENQKKIIDLLLKVNFYDWDGEEMTEDIDYFERSPTSAQESQNIQYQTGQRESFKRRVFIRKRRTAVKPVKAVEAFCTYYFLVVLILMIIFIIQFQRINSDISTELKSLGQASNTKYPGEKYTDAQFLQFVDTSSIIITVDLFGYSGLCEKGEVSLEINGCQNKNFMGPCKFQTDMSVMYNQTGINSPNNSSCRITTTLDYGVEYADITDFYFNIKPMNDYYFYVQRIIYNISTNNNNTSINTGNSYVSGIIQPLQGTILRPDATVSILSMITLISDCKVKSQEQGLSLIRPMIEKCVNNEQSYKEFSFISNSTSFLDTDSFHDVTPTFMFNVHIEKSVFYHYVMNSHSISFGQIITVIMFAILDVFWVIEVIVPLVQTIVGWVEDAIKKRKKKATGEYYEELSSSELENLIKSEQSKSKRDALIRNMIRPRSESNSSGSGNNNGGHHVGSLESYSSLSNYGGLSK